MPTVLITGANRGIGLELASRYASQGWDVIAAVRNVSDMPKLDRVRAVKIEADSLTDAAEVANRLRAENVSLDLVLANAAASLVSDQFERIDPAMLDKTFQTNVRGTLVLFQAMRPLLSKNGKFVVVSSSAGQINQNMNPGEGAYGLTKAAVNFMVRKMHFEDPNLVIMAMHPGWVPTSMGNQGAQQQGLPHAPDDINETIPGMMKTIEGATRESCGGWLTNWDGKRLEF